MDFEELDIEPPDDPEESRSLVPIVAVALVVVALIGFGVYWFTTGEEEEVVQQVAAAPPPARVETPPPQTITPPEPVEIEPVRLPAIDESDELVRQLVTAISSHPGLAQWLVTDGLLRRFVVAVDNVADGRNPSQHLPFMRPNERFAVSGNEPDMRVDPRSYRRYDAHTRIIASLDTDGARELYLHLEPLMDDAYRELGYPDAKFRTRLTGAIEQLLAVPVTDGPPEVMVGAAFYEYTDERLDSLAPVQKQFLGMGPDNVRTVQAKLRAIAAAIGLEPVS